jgi:BTB/POZ domain
LLCKNSPYFAAAFQGYFREGSEQSMTLNEEDGIVSTRSFEVLIQWLYTGHINLGKLLPAEEVAAIIEFARFNDMCGIPDIGALLAGRIESIILKNPAPGTSGSNTWCLEPEHIRSAVLLPTGHPVRGLLANAAVDGYIRQHNHKFAREAREVPGFSADLLDAVRTTIRGMGCPKCKFSFIDPITQNLNPL